MLSYPPTMRSSRRSSASAVSRTRTMFEYVLESRQRPAALLVGPGSRGHPGTSTRPIELSRRARRRRSPLDSHGPGESPRARPRATTRFSSAAATPPTCSRSGASTASTGSSARPGRQGIVLAGWSAGMICWFEAGVTDSFGPQLEGMRDGLGFLPGSACPHYDGEEHAPARVPAARRGGLSGRDRARRRGGGRCTSARRAERGRAPRSRMRAATGSGRTARQPLRARAPLAAAPRAGTPPARPTRAGRSRSASAGRRRRRRRRRGSTTRAPSSEPGSRLALLSLLTWPRRSSTTRSTRCAVSSIDSSEMSITGHPSRRWSFAACSSSS